MNKQAPRNITCANNEIGLMSPLGDEEAKHNLCEFFKVLGEWGDGQLGYCR